MTYSSYLSFVNRYRDTLVAQPERGFGNSRHHWWTYLTFRNIYDDIYAVLKESKLAEKLIQLVMMGGDGNDVSDESNQVGRKVIH